MAYDQRSRHEAQSFHDQRNAEYTVSLSHSQGQRHSDPSRGSFDRKHYGQLESRNHIASQYGGQHGSAHGHAWRDTLQRMDYAQPSGPYPVEGETQGRVQKGQPPTHGPYDRRTRGYGEGNGHGLEGQLMRPGWNERTINQPHLPKPSTSVLVPCLKSFV